MHLNRPLSTVAVLLIIAACSSGPATRPQETFGTGTSGSSGAAGAGGAGAAGSAGGGGTAGTLLPGTGGGTAGVLSSDLPPLVDSGNGCNTALDVTYRDFKVGGDFEIQGWSGDEVRRQLLEPMLGPDQKPVLKSTTGFAWQMGTPLDIRMPPWTARATIGSADSFKQWYNTTAGVNMEIKKQLALTEMPAGSGTYVYSSTSFFPLGNDEGFGVTPAGSGHNYLFTTEIHAKFGYVARQQFTFSGDDDLWIFINGKLALDLGSLHNPADGTIDFDTQAMDLGITPGNTYTMDIFHAERHTTGSNFKITTNISCFTPSNIVQ
jgi:fibro-slime domain-containing protein